MSVLLDLVHGILRSAFPALPVLFLAASAAAAPAPVPAQWEHQLSAHPAPAHSSRRTPVLPNDNRRAAGTLAGGVLTIEIGAGKGVWHPAGNHQPGLEVEAFKEGEGALTVPAPMIRVPEGTEIDASVRNDLDHTLVVNGLCDRSGTACPPLQVPAGEVRQIRFKSGLPGTYHYWATTTGMPLSFRAADDAQLSGAFVVDPAGTEPDADRVLVITEWTAVDRSQLVQILGADDPGKLFLSLKPKVLTTINGAAWPYTERLTYNLDEPVRWRVINLDTQAHPMHLHGFYFAVDSLGTGMRDTHYADGQQQRVVTQLMPPGSTMGMTWTAERVGNWLFHCHIMIHVSPTLAVDGSPLPGVDPHAAHSTSAGDVASAGYVASAGMTGMVLGITVVDPHGPAAATPAMSKASDALPAPVPIAVPATITDTVTDTITDDAPQATARKLTLLMQSEPARFGAAPAMGFVLADRDGQPSTQTVPVPGPALILKRGEPVEITLVNRLAESTAIHWHGMELDSYYDGVHAFGGDGTQVTPMIEPGRSFVVRFTPPRAGTFMYHTHVHDNRQLTSGMYGAMLVVEPDETFDEKTDHVFVIGRGGPELAAVTVLNGSRSPVAVWQAGVRHRVRLINITPGDIFSLTLQTAEGPVNWRPLTKDGAPLPPDRCESGPAKVVISVGETYDFEYLAPPGRRNLWLEVRGMGGSWQVQGQVILK